MNRSSEVTIGNTTIQKSLIKGVPQGGVLSPIIWNYAFDEFLNLKFDKKAKVVGFADDSVILIQGSTLNNNVKCMNKVLKKVNTWGTSVGLTFNAKKTTAVLFSKKNIKTEIPPVELGGTEIPLSDSVTYLGIILDEQLTFRKHIENKINKAKQHLMILNSNFGSYYGPQP